MRIKWGRAADCLRITELADWVGADFGMTPVELHRWMDGPRNTVAIAEDDAGRIAGFVLYTRNPPDSDITYSHLTTSASSPSVSGALVAWLKLRLRERGKLQTMVLENDVAMQCQLAKWGFRCVSSSVDAEGQQLYRFEWVRPINAEWKPYFGIADTRRQGVS